MNKAIRLWVGFLLFLGSLWLPAKDGVRILFTPLSADLNQDYQWPGLALALGLSDQVAASNQLISMTTYRKKLDEHGFLFGFPLSLASRIRVAQELQADWLIYGSIHAGGLELNSLDLATMVQEKHVFPLFDEHQFAQACSQLAGLLQLDMAETELNYEVYSIWASAYFIEDVSTSQRVFRRLLEQGSTGYLLLQEYLDLFGEPETDNVDELVAWRSIFFEKNHFQLARDFSQKVIDTRNEPEDYLFHARILLALRDDDACTFVKRVEDTGLAFEGWEKELDSCREGGQLDDTQAGERQTPKSKASR